VENDPLAEKIIGAAIEVRPALGPGLLNVPALHVGIKRMVW
jgi:hypothetical protein